MAKSSNELQRHREQHVENILNDIKRNEYYIIYNSGIQLL